MKKLMLSICLIAAFAVTSCKNGEVKKEAEELEEVEEVVEDVAEDVETETKVIVKKETEVVVENTNNDVVGVTIPDFSNDKVEENLKSYVMYAKNYIANKNNPEKLKEIVENGKKIMNDGKSLVALLPKKEQDLYAKTIAEIQGKIDPAE